MRLVTLLALLVVVSPLATAQIPDPTDPARYYPLAVGDTWHYSRELFDEHVTVREVTRDTSVADTAYAVVRERIYRRPLGSDAFELEQDADALLRYDPLSTAVYERHPEQGESQRTFPLGVDFGRCESDGCEYVAVSQEETEFGAGKMFESLATASVYVADIGLVGSYAEIAYSEELIYANVGGVEWGEPSVVARETNPRTQPLALTASPNPTAGPLAVTLRQRQRGAVRLEAFDALGRRVYCARSPPRQRRASRSTRPRGRRGCTCSARPLAAPSRRPASCGGRPLAPAADRSAPEAREGLAESRLGRIGGTGAG